MTETKSETAQRLYPGLTFDTALPQEWVDTCTTAGIDVRPHFVWAYPERSIFGCPAPISPEGEQIAAALRLIPLVRVGGTHQPSR